MNAVRAGAWSAMATAARLLAALVIIKLVAWIAGPVGVGKLGQFMSLMSILAVLAGGGISSAIVKYVAEYRYDAHLLDRLLAAALWYALSASVLTGIVALVASRPLAAWLLGDVHFASLIRILAFAQIGMALANYILAVINGFMDVRRLAFIQVTGSLVGMIVAVWLAKWLQLYGALLAMIITQLLWLAVGLPAWRRSPYFRPGMWRLRFDAEMTWRLAAFSVMTLTSALMPPLVGIAVRDHLALQFGWEQVGYWQAVSKVSDAYLLFLTTAINVYYLPKLAATEAPEDIVRELRQAWRIVLPLVVGLALLVYLARDGITHMLFSADFGSANALYGPQLVGDVIKIASFVLSYLMLAKAMTRLFVVSECVFALTYVALVYVLTAHYGLIGAMYAFALNYVGYLVFTAVVAHRYLGVRA
ncbi:MULTISPECIES: O-antigen translocase [Dyella]|uniref:O-antigen translocase n=2 Tax=Dyella TaxID=231454 RepID=A0A4R0YU52_9GAMM|nr:MULTISPECIES: O-antigen translocase [Dyella]TBR39470.1 O-antigen translocase [Dyella terrae]TCI12945.1 O-antigen translocase [Dyella soli]